MTCGVGGPGAFLIIGFGVWTISSIHVTHKFLFLFLAFFNKRNIYKKDRKQVFSWPRGLARRSVPTGPTLAHPPRPGPPAPFPRHRVTPTNPLTNRAGHTHSSSHCNRLPHTVSHLPVGFWFCSIWVFNFTGSVPLHPPFVWSSIWGAFNPLLQS